MRTNGGAQAPGTKQWDEITANFFMNSINSDSRGSHSAMEAIDNDDGSAYYNTHSNVFAYVDSCPSPSPALWL